MKKLLLGFLLLVASQLIHAQIDTSKIIDIYWESVKVENNESTMTLKENEKSYLVFHKDGFFSFVFSLADLKKTSKNKWVFERKTQSFVLSDASGADSEKIILKVISVNDLELVVKPNFAQNVNKIYFKRLTKFK